MELQSEPQSQNLKLNYIILQVNRHKKPLHSYYSRKRFSTLILDIAMYVLAMNKIKYEHFVGNMWCTFAKTKTLYIWVLNKAETLESWSNFENGQKLYLYHLLKHKHFKFDHTNQSILTLLIVVTHYCKDAHLSDIMLIL